MYKSILKKSSRYADVEESPPPAVNSVYSSPVPPESGDERFVRGNVQGLPVPQSSAMNYDSGYTPASQSYMNIFQNLQVRRESAAAKQDVNRNLLAQALAAKSRLGLMEDPVGIQGSKALAALQDYGYETEKSGSAAPSSSLSSSTYYDAQTSGLSFARLQNVVSLCSSNMSYPDSQVAAQSSTSLPHLNKQGNEVNLYSDSPSSAPQNLQTGTVDNAPLKSILKRVEETSFDIMGGGNCAVTNPSTVPAFQSIDDEDEFLYGEVARNPSPKTETAPSRDGSGLSKSNNDTYFRPSFEFLSSISSKIPVEQPSKAGKQSAKKLKDENKAGGGTKESPSLSSSLASDELDDEALYSLQKGQRKLQIQSNLSEEKAALDIFELSPPHLKNKEREVDSNLWTRKKSEGLELLKKISEKITGAQNQSRVESPHSEGAQPAAEPSLSLVPHPLCKVISAKKSTQKSNLSDMQTSVSANSKSRVNKVMNALLGADEIAVDAVAPSPKKQTTSGASESSVGENSAFDKKKSSRESPGTLYRSSGSRESSLTESAHSRSKDSRSKRTSHGVDAETVEGSSKRLRHHSPEYHRSKYRKYQSDSYRSSKEYPPRSSRLPPPSYRKHREDISYLTKDWAKSLKSLRSDYIDRYKHKYPSTSERHYRDYRTSRSPHRHHSPIRDHERRSRRHSRERSPRRKSYDRDSSNSSREGSPRGKSKDRSNRSRDSPRRSRRDDFESKQPPVKTSNKSPEVSSLVQALSDIESPDSGGRVRSVSLSSVSPEEQMSPDSVREISQERGFRILPSDGSSLKQMSPEALQKKEKPLSEEVDESTRLSSASTQGDTPEQNSESAVPPQEAQKKEDNTIIEFFRRLESNRQMGIKQLKDIVSIVGSDSSQHANTRPSVSASDGPSKLVSPAVQEVQIDSITAAQHQANFQTAQPAYDAPAETIPSPALSVAPTAVQSYTSVASSLSYDMSYSDSMANFTSSYHPQYAQSIPDYGAYHQQYQYQQPYYNMHPAAQYYSPSAVPEGAGMVYPPNVQPVAKSTKHVKKVEPRQSFLKPIRQIKSPEQKGKEISSPSTKSSSPQKHTAKENSKTIPEDGVSASKADKQRQPCQTTPIKLVSKATGMLSSLAKSEGTQTSDNDENADSTSKVFGCELPSGDTPPKEKLSVALKRRSYRINQGVKVLTTNSKPPLAPQTLKELITSQEKLFSEIRAENQRMFSCLENFNENKRSKKNMKKCFQAKLEMIDIHIQSAKEYSAKISQAVEVQAREADPSPKSVEVETKYNFYDDGVHFCKDCEKVFLTLPQKLSHLVSAEHEEATASNERQWSPPPASCSSSSIKTEASASGKLTAIKGIDFMVPVKGLYCTLCNKCVPSENHAEEHLKTAEHYDHYKKYIEEHPMYEKAQAALLKRVINSLEEKKLTKASHSDSEQGTAVVKKENEKKSGAGGGGVSMRISNAKKGKGNLASAKASQKPVFIGKAPNYLARLVAKTKDGGKENEACSETNIPAPEENIISSNSEEPSKPQQNLESKSKIPEKKDTKLKYPYVPSYEESIRNSEVAGQNGEKTESHKEAGSAPASEVEEKSSHIVAEDMDISDEEEPGTLMKTDSSKKNSDSVDTASRLPSPPGIAPYVMGARKAEPRTDGSTHSLQSIPLPVSQLESTPDLAKPSMRSSPSCQAPVVPSPPAVSSGIVGVEQKPVSQLHKAGVATSAQNQFPGSSVGNYGNNILFPQPPPPGNPSPPGVTDPLPFQPYNSVHIPPYPPPLRVPPPPIPRTVPPPNCMAPPGESVSPSSFPANTFEAMPPLMSPAVRVPPPLPAPAVRMPPPYLNQPLRNHIPPANIPLHMPVRKRSPLLESPDRNLLSPTCKKPLLEHPNVKPMLQPLRKRRSSRFNSVSSDNDSLAGKVKFAKSSSQVMKDQSVEDVLLKTVEELVSEVGKSVEASSAKERDDNVEKVLVSTKVSNSDSSDDKTTDTTVASNTSLDDSQKMHEPEPSVSDAAAANQTSDRTVSDQNAMNDENTLALCSPVQKDKGAPPNVLSLIQSSSEISKDPSGGTVVLHNPSEQSPAGFSNDHSVDETITSSDQMSTESSSNANGGFSNDHNVDETSTSSNADDGTKCDIPAPCHDLKNSVCVDDASLTKEDDSSRMKDHECVKNMHLVADIQSSEAIRSCDDLSSELFDGTVSCDEVDASSLEHNLQVAETPVSHYSPVNEEIDIPKIIQPTETTGLPSVSHVPPTLDLETMTFSTVTPDGFLGTKDSFDENGQVPHSGTGYPYSSISTFPVQENVLPEVVPSAESVSVSSFEVEPQVGSKVSIQNTVKISIPLSMLEKQSDGSSHLTSSDNASAVSTHTEFTEPHSNLEISGGDNIESFDFNKSSGGGEPLSEDAFSKCTILHSDSGVHSEPGNAALENVLHGEKEGSQSEKDDGNVLMETETCYTEISNQISTNGGFASDEQPGEILGSIPCQDSFLKSLNIMEPSEAADKIQECSPVALGFKGSENDVYILPDANCCLDQPTESSVPDIVGSSSYLSPPRDKLSGCQDDVTPEGANVETTCMELDTVKPLDPSNPSVHDSTVENGQNISFLPCSETSELPGKDQNSPHQETTQESIEKCMSAFAVDSSRDHGKHESLGVHDSIEIENSVTHATDVSSSSRVICESQSNEVVVSKCAPSEKQYISIHESSGTGRTPDSSHSFISNKASPSSRKDPVSENQSDAPSCDISPGDASAGAVGVILLPDSDEDTDIEQPSNFSSDVPNPDEEDKQSGEDVAALCVESTDSTPVSPSKVTGAPKTRKRSRRKLFTSRKKKSTIRSLPKVDQT